MSVARLPSRRAVFLDRDGTMNVDLKYISDPKQLELYSGVISGLRLLSRHGYVLVVVTNQSGIARGLYTHDTVHRLHERIQEILRGGDVAIDRFYYCPHAPEDGCSCRKPGTELFLRAAEELGIHLSSSALIGNNDLDVAAGKKLGLFTALVKSPGFSISTDTKEYGGPSVETSSFVAACHAILSRG